MTRRRELGHALAEALLAGPWTRRAMVARIDRALEQEPRWLWDLVDAVLDGYHHPPLDRPRELGAYVAIVLDELDPLRPAASDPAAAGPAAADDPDAEPPSPDAEWPPLAPIPRVIHRATFHPAMGFARWPVPRIDTVGDLAAYLGLEAGALEWLADVRGLERVVGDERLRHYRYARIPRRGGPPRVLEAPKPRLKALQRRLLHEVLDRIPVHAAAHGFVRGRSARTHALAHVGRRIVVRLDLEDFFAGVSAARVFGIFRAAGYPESVAHVLTGLCTNAVPPEQSVPAHWRLSRRLATPHLPQGAPTSPALANLAAFALDRRLSGLASAIGATYTRYADDLVLSSDRRLRTPVAAITEIARAEGFRVNAGKTRVMGRGRRQTVTGVVVNAQPNVPRAEYDTLKATLHRARLDGPAGLDPTVLLGRIAWVESLNPTRGAKLRTAFAAITWPTGGERRTPGAPGHSG